MIIPFFKEKDRVFIWLILAFSLGELAYVVNVKLDVIFSFQSTVKVSNLAAADVISCSGLYCNEIL
ncbi:hypothetical protein D0469_07450 [Peribacillus saganii]|uniref:Uncharacterized protein n=1 Tax=Peribacillus saganii TaxID=2303992 RepID=A0A372LQD0_9BACI|nr:hypothetical protein D0469_07450 [Peribacillus saganii]